MDTTVSAESDFLDQAAEAGASAPGGVAERVAGEAAPIGQSGGVDYSKFIDAQGNFAAPVAGKFKTLEGLVKGYESAQKLIGAHGDRVAVPTENSSDEQWASFWEKLGRPSEPSGYAFEVSDEVKKLEGVYDEEGMRAYAQLAHKVGLTSKQANAIADMYFKGMEQQHAQFEEQQRAALEGYEQELSKEWGPRGGARWKRNEQLADVGMDALGISAEDVASMPEARSPAFLKAMVKVAGMIRERPASGIGGENGARGGFDSDVQSQINAIIHDTSGPYYKREHPGHDAAVAQVERLMKLKLAEGS